uniref:Uncharacterized protein n=1 Tax=Ananas comosus var. bracteatus TaxID=296719 RepID=A0A6V7PK50_ANACO|nr:unnamed protein product [Ananas comosus var. bracteatus]
MAAGGSWWRRGVAEGAQPTFSGSTFDHVNFYAGAAGSDRGILVAILIVSCIMLAGILFVAAVWLYRSRLALADWIRGRGTLTPSHPAQAVASSSPASPDGGEEEGAQGALGWPGKKKPPPEREGRSQSAAAPDPVGESQAAPIEPDGRGRKDDGERDAAHYEDRDEDPTVAAGGPHVEVDVVEGAAGEAGLPALGRHASPPRAGSHRWWN